jgi:hypothetical protein
MDETNMTKDEKSLLLFLETRAVDYGGRVNLQHMNQDDVKIAEKWNEEGFLEFGRIVIRNHNSDGTHWVKLTNEAFRVAHKLRRERADRMYQNRTWLSTKESKEMYGDPHLNGMNNQEQLISNPHKEEYN